MSTPVQVVETILDPSNPDHVRIANEALYLWSSYHHPERVEGIPPLGKFTPALYALLDVADPEQRDRLAMAYPRHVDAHRLVLGELGIPTLRRIAAGQPTAVAS